MGDSLTAPGASPELCQDTRMASAGRTTAHPPTARNLPRTASRIAALAAQTISRLSQLPAAISVAGRHVARDPWKAVSVGLRASPAPLRERFRHGVVRRRLPLVAVVADAAAGDRERAAAGLRELALDGPVDSLLRVAAVASVLDRPDLASLAVERLPEDAPEATRIRALAEWAQGNGRTAVALATQAARSGGARERSLHASLASELRVLEAPEVHDLPERAPRSGVSESGGAGRDARPLRVLHVVTNALPEVQAGYTIRTQGIAESQRGAGIDAHVVTRLGFPVDSGALAASRDFVHQTVPTHRLLPLRGLPVLAHERIRVGADALTRLAECLEIDVLHAHSKHENGQVALLAGERLGLPVVYEARGFLEETWRSRGGDPASDYYLLSKEAETACMRAADAVVAVSRAMVTDIVTRGIPAAKVNLVGNAVSAEFLEPAPDATRLRARLGIAEDAVAVGMVSTLNDYEGIDLLIDAVAAVDDPRLVLLVVGDGPALADLQRRAAERLGPDRATFTGRVPHDEAHAHHAALDVFCVPRLRTPVTELVPPLKPLEAMATARPVVVSDLPPLLELVGDGLDTEPRGLAATAGDAASWSEALRRLLYDSTLRADLGAAGRNWVAEHRTWKAAAATYAGIYRDISRSRVPTREAARE